MIAAEAAARSAAGAIDTEAWQQGADYGTAMVTEQGEQVRVLRDIFGNPFRPASVGLSCVHWNDNTVVKLAQGIYDDRAFDHLPILADALEDAGCQDPVILDHCRHPGPHVRGCWVVDLVTGRS